MAEDKFYLQASDVDKESFISDNKISIEWNIAYLCNYRCPYCFFEGKWEEYEKRNVFYSVEDWDRLWKRLFDLYGSVSITVTGGEPFIYPDFINIIKAISKYHYPINISSNGSGDLEEFAREIDPEKVSVSLTFHPEFNSLEDILKKKRFLSEKGYQSDYINLCVYPPYLENIDEYVKIAAGHDEKLKIIPFIGEYKGERYPDAYSPAEKKILGMDEVWENNVKRKGTLCAAGMRSALIFPDGKVARCGQIGEDFIIGNFFEGDFKLLEQPLECEADMCPCLETIEVEDK